jgi:ribonuclease G
MGLNLGKTRLWAFDIATGKLARKIDLPASVAPKGAFLQDLSVDAERGWVYLADIAPPGLVAIDINTGRFVGKHNLEDTILKTNLEAVKEIAFQLRLRNIGGLIIIDFIDMEKEPHREKVHAALEEALKNDKAKTNILKISELGLVEMTRKRVRESIGRILCEPCPYCEGKGYVKSKTTMAYEIFRDLQREMRNAPGYRMTLNVHPNVASLLYDEERSGIEELEKYHQKQITIHARPGFHIEQFEILVG